MERGVKISSKFLIGLAAFLLLVVGITTWMNASEVRNTDGTTLTITKKGEVVAVYSLEELMNMKSETVYVEIVSGKGEDEKGNYTGVMLKELLTEAGVDMAEVETVIFTAGDGYSSAGKEEEAEEIMITHTKDGETLGYFTKGGTGPLRCMFLKDYFGNRSIQYLTAIECQ